MMTMKAVTAERVIVKTVIVKTVMVETMTAKMVTMKEVTVKTMEAEIAVMIRVKSLVIEKMRMQESFMKIILMMRWTIMMKTLWIQRGHCGYKGESPPSFCNGQGTIYIAFFRGRTFWFYYQRYGFGVKVRS